MKYSSIWSIRSDEKNEANTRTSTCFCGCTKWKRSSPKRKDVTNQVMTLAEVLMENLHEVNSRDASFNRVDEEFIFERINYAKDQLLDSGVATEHSKIIDRLEDLKKYFCTRHQLNQHQRTYQESVGETDAMTMEKLNKLLGSGDLVDAVKQFIRNFQTEKEANILDFHIENNVVNQFTLSGVIRLKFNYRKNNRLMARTVILKIPSLSPTYYSRQNKNIFDREAHFYETLLPALYKLGRCEPFSAELYAATPARALVLEDLSAEGYRHYQLGSEYMDLQHSKASLRVLAKYHALSYTYLGGLDPDELSSSLIGPHQSGITMVTKVEQFEAFLTVIKPSLGKSALYRRILEAEDKILADLPTTNVNNENSMNVIVHGDFCRRNILFKYDSSQQVCGAKIIDWQFGREASPILDLIDFFLTDLSIDLFQANEDDLLKSYLNSLNDNLSTNRAYNRSELDADMEFYKYHFFRVLSIIAREIVNLELQKTKSYASNVAKWVLYLEKKGFI